MSRVLLLPGSQWQVPLAKKIKEMENWLCVVSPEAHPPCSLFADEFFRSDIFAIDSIEQYARKHKIGAIISDECDIAMPVVAELGRKLNLPTLSSEAAALFTDKFLMREFCTEHGLKTPEYRLCRTVDEAISFQKGLRRPIIIKPLDSNASHGVFKVESEEEIRAHFDEALIFSRIEHAVLAERFIEGIEFTIDGIKTPSKHFTLAISEKKHFKHNMNIADELYFTHSNTRFDYEKLKATNDAFVMKSPLFYGFTHGEYKCENGDFYLIEIGARGGGNMISSLITQYMSGYDTYRYLIECACGNIHEESFEIRKEYLQKASILKFFKTPNGGGVVKDVCGIDYLENEPDIKEFHLNFNIGDTIEDAKSDSARIGFYIACSDSEEKLNNIIKNVENKFKILV